MFFETEADCVASRDERERDSCCVKRGGSFYVVMKVVWSFVVTVARERDGLDSWFMWLFL